MSRLMKVVISLIVIVIICVGSGYGYFYYKLSKVHESGIDDSDLRKFTHKNKKGITNILLIGVDARPGEKNSRSDAVMIVTIDNTHKDIKLTSLARDSYVDIPNGHGYQKLAHANAYGGPALLIKTIEKNFNIDINEYVTVHFESFIDLVDLLGGVKVDVKKSYFHEFNRFLKEDYQFDDKKHKGQMKYVTKPGLQTLNGYQALTFARIRHNDTAYERDRRQREVLKSVMNKLKDLPVNKYNKVLDILSPYIKTSMEPNDIMSYALNVKDLANNVKELEFPIDDGVNGIGGIYSKSGWVLRYKKESLKYLYNFIFDDIPYKKNVK